ncbi:MAG: BBP7 family outer membrane beta-barrel protein [Pirellulaceae bacterium]|nr:BBP7 family outer membrane beta-barrel protein [Pirellulaceae bacterium]
MPVQRKSILVGVTLVALSFATAATGQIQQPPGPTYHPSGATNFNILPLLPIVDPDEFDPDLQFFAPAELGEFGEVAATRTGFFFTFDRIMTRVSRPGPVVIDVNSEPFGAARRSDFGWGNRYELGYMTEDNHGWIATIWDLKGPNFVGELRELEFDFDPEDEENDPEEEDFDADNDQIVAPRSINVAKYSSFELSKSFRLEQLHYGGVVEPYLGLRYSVFKDRTNGATVFNDITPDPVDESVNQIITRSLSGIENSMFGGHLGLRWVKNRNRWKLSGDIRTFAMQNWQLLEGRGSVETINYSELNLGDENFRTLTRSEFSDDAAEFVFGGEVRVSVAYEVWRDVAFRVGYDFLYLAQGIARGADLSQNNEEAHMSGLTFGIDIKR